ncbi:hypothetical protein [Kitasatospora purpeofusca]|uniref:hypothetical protein n=1 Tax=Kitasatospora purpeofusca TaxID=67352 RepID=UPI0036AE8CBF
MNLYLSLLRTAVPGLVGWVVALAARYGLDLDPAGLAAVVAPVASFDYYAVFRFAEVHVSPVWGWLLGYARPPLSLGGKAVLPSS